MKTLTIIILAVILTACGGGELPEIATTVISDRADVASNLASNESVIAIEPVVTPTVQNPVQICPQSTGCEPSPALLPPNKLPRTPPVTPEPICVRDSSPLVDVGAYFVDNCGNTYGKTSS